METNLDEVKKMAYNFLELEPKPVGNFGDLFVSHPYINTSHLLDPKTGAFFHIFTEPEKFKAWKNFYKKKIEQYKDIYSIILLIQNPYKLTFFKYINEYLSEKDFAEVLIHCYTSEEFVSADVNVTKNDIMSWFKKANKEFAMDKEEKEVFGYLPEYVEIFRGVGNKKYKNGYSWTLNLETATFFANRFHSNNPTIYKCLIHKKDILMYINGRGEEEIIVNTRNLNKYKIEEIKSI